MAANRDRANALLLRPLAPKDLNAAAVLLLQTNHGLTEAELAEDLASSMAKWPTVQIGAFNDEELVGLIAGRVDGSVPTIGYSDDVVIKAHLRRTGLGSQLLDAQLNAFRSLGCRCVRGLSPQSLLHSLAFFERHGFKVIRRVPAHQVWGIAEGEEIFVTEKLLS